MRTAGIRAGLPLSEAWILDNDYFGRARGPLPTVGAVKGQIGPIISGVEPRNL